MLTIWLHFSLILISLLWSLSLIMSTQVEAYLIFVSVKSKISKLSDKKLLCRGSVNMCSIIKLRAQQKFFFILDRFEDKRKLLLCWITEDSPYLSNAAPKTWKQSWKPTNCKDTDGALFWKPFFKIVHSTSKKKKKQYWRKCISYDYIFMCPQKF